MAREARRKNQKIRMVANMNDESACAQGGNLSMSDVVDSGAAAPQENKLRTALRGSVEYLEITVDVMHHISAILVEIQISAGKGTSIYHLASAAQYLSDNWANSMDCEVEAITEKHL